MKRSTLLILAALFAFSGSLNAAEKPNLPKKTVQSSQPIYRPASQFQMSPEELKAERERLDKVANHSEKVFTLLLGEMALNQGDIGSAIGIYLRTLRETKNPDVVERAMELAIDARAYDVAELVFDEWKKLEPTPSPALRRLEWIRALALGENDFVIKNMKTVFAEAKSDTHRQKMFLVLAQMVAVRSDLAKEAKNEIFQVADQYPQFTESVIADAIVSTENGETRRALVALSRLANLDKDISPQTALSLHILVQKNPQLLQQFFATNTRTDLSQTWRELEVQSLIADKKYDVASKKIQHLLSDAPNAELYLQAAHVSELENKPLTEIMGYIEKAYQSATSDKRDTIALVAAMYLGDVKEYAQMQNWINRITSSDRQFDKMAWQLTVYAQQENWQQVYDLAKKIQLLPEKESKLFAMPLVKRAYWYAATQILPKERVLTIFAQDLAKLERDKKNPNRDEMLSALLYQRGLYYSDTSKNHTLAIKDLRRYVALNPDNAAGLNALGYTLLTDKNTKNWDKAPALIERAYQIEPENAAINDSLGWVYYKKGDFKQALSYLQFAYEHEPNAETGAHLGAAYWQLGDQEKAHQIFAECAKMEDKNGVLAEILRGLGVK